MTPSFCAAATRRTDEDAIGTAEHYQTYVLIECPYPWTSNALDSAQLPTVLRQFIAATCRERSIRFLCINRGRKAAELQRTKVLVYEAIKQSTVPLCYRGFEFSLSGLDQVVDCLQAYWQGLAIGQPIADIQDVLICTHGMRDKCCARFGQPFFRAAEKLVKSRDLPQVRVWRVSHIGGHRFAPTAILFPTGRYYAQLTVPALHSLLTHTGTIDLLRNVYRGWGLLPKPLQILERRLFLEHSWDWLNCCLSYHIESDDGETMRALLWVEQADGNVVAYRAEVVRSHDPAHQIHTSCNANCPYIPVQYTITDFTTLIPSPSTVPAQPLPSALRVTTT